MKKFKIGLIGFGNIGQKRFNSLCFIKNIKIQIEYIVEKNKKNKTPKNIKRYDNYQKINLIPVDLIIVAVPTKISEKIIKNLAGKFNLLVEKPISTNLRLINSFIQKSNTNNKIIKIGYNLRFDDGLIKTKNIFDKNKIGQIYYVKINYANGAAKTNTNSVGSLYDMGSHSLNLLKWFFQDSYFSIKKTLHQKNEFLRKTKIDNGFSLIKIDDISCFFHHGFCNWNNIFKFEIYGSKGYLEVSSLSKWGNQIVSYGLRKYPSGKPFIKQFKFKIDNSWKNEIIFVINSILKSDKKNKVSINNESSDVLKLINKIKKNEKY
tara:strand:+ start:15 stop:974 length:960 start_codon:yes stop_codon:yes gene_type:complete